MNGETNIKRIEPLRKERHMNNTIDKNSQCIKLNTCYKIKMILDKDLAGDWQYAQCIKEVCKLCEKKEITINVVH